MGIVIQAIVQGRTYSLPIPVVVHSNPDALRIILNDEVEDQNGDRAILNLRSLPGRQRTAVRLKNPTGNPRNVIVQLRCGMDDSGPVLASRNIALPAFATLPLSFETTQATEGETSTAFKSSTTAGSNPAQNTNSSMPVALDELTTPLRFRVLDAQRTSLVLGERVLPVKMANPADYVRVQQTSLTPPRLVAKEANRLSIVLHSLLPPRTPDVPASLVLRRERIPGLLGVSQGVLQGTLHAGGELRLSADGINVDSALASEGVIEVSVDGVERAILLKSSFVQNKNPVTPRLDETIGLRLRAPAMAKTGSTVPVVLEVDNAPIGSTLELTLGRLVSGNFEPIETWLYPSTRHARIGLNPSPPGGGLEFEASLGDWSQSIETGGLRGKFPLRARLLRSDGLMIKETQQEMLLDDQPPRWLNFVGLPSIAKRGSVMTIKALGDSPPSGIATAEFFLGKPDADGKLSSGVTPVAGKRLPGKIELWAAELKLPADKSALDVTVTARFVSSVGMQITKPSVIALSDTEPIETGSLLGIVQQGLLAQSNLSVGLFDSKGNKLQECRSSETGLFQFNEVPPGLYFVTAARPVDETRGQVKVEIKAGEISRVNVELFR
jgi:hypothetical protein